MALISLVFILALALHYAASQFENFPPALRGMAARVTENIRPLSYWGVIYGILALVLSPLTADDGSELAVHLLANAMIFLMALPLALDMVLERHHEKVPAVLVAELRNLVGWITRNEKAVALAGGIMAVLLFVTMLG